MKKNEEVTLKQKNILIRMNTQFPLVDLCDEIEKQTSGRFTFNYLIDVINVIYSNISNEDKKFFISNIGLGEINADSNNPYITLLNLFNYFSKIIGYRIVCPILCFYYIAELLDQKIRMSTSEFVQRQGFSSNIEININEFNSKIVVPLKLDDLTAVIIFKALDYNRKALITIEEFVLVIDSYRGSNNSFNTLTPKQKQALVFDYIIQKNFISLKDSFDKHCQAPTDRVQYSLILMDILTKKSKKDGYDHLISSVLESIKDIDNRISYEDLMKYLPEIKPQPLTYRIKLSNSQVHWLTKYLRILNELKVKPKDVFESCLKSNSRGVNLTHLHSQLQIIIPDKYITSSELNHIIESLDIDQTMTIEYPEYSMLLQEASNLKDSNIISEEQIMSSSHRDQTLKIKYTLLPIKGNMKILIKQKNELLFNLMLNKRKRGEDSKINQSQFLSKTTQLQMPSNYISKEIKQQQKDKEEFKSTMSEKTKIAYNMSVLNYEDYVDEYKIIYLTESINLRAPIITCGEVVNHFITKGNFHKQKANNLIKMIDKNNDGYISGLDILHFLLKYMQHRSTILAVKYIFAVISCELKTTPDNWLKSKNIKQTDIIHSDKFCRLLQDSFGIELPIAKMLNEKIENSNTAPIIYSMFVLLLNQYYVNEFNETEHVNDDVITQCEMLQIDIEVFESQIKNIIDSIVNNDIQDYSLKQKSFKENLMTVLGRIEKEELLFSEYMNWFVKAFYLDINCSQTIFSILKKKSSKKKFDVIRPNDLYNFLSAFVEPSRTQLRNRDDLLNQFDQIGPPLNITLEHMPFNQKGGLPVIELMQVFTKFYPTILKDTIRTFLAYLDNDQNGFITFTSLQQLLNGKGLFSFKIESMHIISKILMNDYTNATDYFNKEDIASNVSDYRHITKDEHCLIMKQLCTNENNSNELFNYLCNIQNRKESYDISKFITLLNCYCYQLNCRMNTVQTTENEASETTLPNKSIIENMLMEISIKSFERIPIGDIENLIQENQAAYFIRQIDSHRIGFIAFTDLFEKLRSLYGNEINLFNHLIAQYTYQVIIHGNTIEDWILYKSNQPNLKSCLSKKEFYSIFKECFLNDEPLFNIFYKNYKEPIGNNYGLIKLKRYAEYLMESNLLIERSEGKIRTKSKRSHSKSSKSDKSSKNNSPQKTDANYNMKTETKYNMKTESNYKSQVENHPKMATEGNRYIKRDDSSISINNERHQLRRNESDSFSSSSKSLQIVAKNKEKEKEKEKEYHKKRKDVPYMKSYNILFDFEEKHLPIKNIIEMIEPKVSNLSNDCSIKKEYLKLLLISKLAFYRDNADIILSDFILQDNIDRFDLKSFAAFVNQYFDKSKIDIKNIISKIKRFILISIETDKNTFITNNFGKSIVKLTEAVYPFKQMNISLYECLMIIGDNASSFDVSNFFSDNSLNELFSSKSFDPKLRSSLRKLKDYFGSVSNRDRLFRKFDLNNDGILTPNEFIQAINKCKGLSLSQNQKQSIVRVIDIDQDGKINPAEFINFLEVLKFTDNDKNQNLPLINNNSTTSTKKSVSQFVSLLLTDISIIKENLNINQQALVENKTNTFLNNIVILQQDIVRNFYNQNCLENSLKTYDSKKDGLIPNDALLICLKEKLLSIETLIFTKFKHLSEHGLTQDEKSNNIINQKINYKRFLINLANYNHIVHTQK